MLGVRRRLWLGTEGALQVLGRDAHVLAVGGLLRHAVQVRDEQRVVGVRPQPRPAQLKAACPEFK